MGDRNKKHAGGQYLGRVSVPSPNPKPRSGRQWRCRLVSHQEVVANVLGRPGAKRSATVKSNRPKNRTHGDSAEIGRLYHVNGWMDEGKKCTGLTKRKRKMYALRHAAETAQASAMLPARPTTKIIYAY